MTLLKDLEIRSENKCELCGNTTDLKTYLVPPKVEEIVDHQVALCTTCHPQVTDDKEIDANHMRCLNESIWSEADAVKVVSYRLLKRLSVQDWAGDLLGMMYLDESAQEWADAASGQKVIHKDSNGNILSDGDAVTLIQDLNVKGAGFTAKRGVAVKRIRLVRDNPEHIEGKIDGQQIVILTKYVKKSN
jgi:protein PhnA